MADGATQPEVKVGQPHEQAAPRWMLTAMLLLLIAVVGLGWIVGTRVVSRRTQAALAEDPRLRILKKAVRDNPDDLGARRQLAQVYLQGGREKDALREYAGVLSRNPDDVAALHGAGVLYLADGQNEAGEEALLRVLELDPTHTYAALALAEHYTSTKRVDGVVRVLKPAADSHPEIADLQYLLGFGYEETGDSAAAVKYYRRALRFVPDMKEAQEALDRLGAGL